MVIRQHDRVGTLPLHNSTRPMVFVLLLGLRRFGRVSLGHLFYQIFEDLSNMPISLGRGLVERKAPSFRKRLDSTSLHLALIGQIELRTHDNNRNSLPVMLSRR